MPLRSYGVLTARVVDRRREDDDDDSPHFQIQLADDGGTRYRAAVNVKSQESPSELLYLVVEDFRHPVADLLPAAPVGWTPLPPGPGGPNLDYIRGNVLDPAAMRPLPANATGPDNDLPDLLDHYVERAMADPQALLHVFGERWGPERVSDKIFGFAPGNGVHDVHMNQGNSAAFRRDDGPWQDGGLLFHFPAASQWVAIFLAFQSQAWHTDDVTGHALDGTDPRPQPDRAAAMRIVAAMVNPIGPAPEKETVTVINASPAAVDLTGWRLADRLKHTCPVPGGPVAAGATLTVPASDGVQLGNSGGAITLLDPAGIKVHGVSYTSDQVRQEGWTAVF
jgi:uncharacterized protein YukJ